MTREEIYDSCVKALEKTNCLLLEAATGTGKSKIAINLINHIAIDKLHRPVSVLLLVAKRVHKQTWNDEIEKWGGVKGEVIVMECYESLKKYAGKHYDVVLGDEVHHIGSDARLDCLSKVKFDWFIGLSATINRNLKYYFKYHYHSQIVSCDIIEAIDSEILPEPEIVLMPLELDNRKMTETIEINAKSKGPVLYAEYKDIWKFRKSKRHAVISCTQKQKSIEMNSQILYAKNKYMKSKSEVMKQAWLNQCGRRLEFYADCKVPLIKDILKKLSRQRTITFCKTIRQAEILGRNCIHSKKNDAEKVYNDFNDKKINHITAVNILNENANLVDCKYAVFTNLSSSDTVTYQRLGRGMRHKSPVLVIPYYKGTREEELVDKLTEGFDRKYIRTVNSIEEI